jgi:two-component system KDP operon response regulator KdpE
MDLNLPSQAGQDGAALLEQLKRNAPHVPVVVHAFSSEEALEAGTLRLASAVVEKSGNTEDLKAAVRKALAHGNGGGKA